MQGQRFRLESATARPHKLRLARRVKVTPRRSFCSAARCSARLASFSSIHCCAANCIIIAPKRLKLRLSGSARKSQKRFQDTPRFKFQAIFARTQPFYHAA